MQLSISSLRNRAKKIQDIYRYISLRLDPVPCDDGTKGLKNRKLLGCAISLGGRVGGGEVGICLGNFAF